MPSRRLLGTLFLVSTGVMLPLWVIAAFQWPASGDILFYAAALNGFSAQLWSGDIYPRWLLSSNAGLGAPIFLFYSPAAFYLMSLLEWLKPVDPYGTGRIILGMQAALVACGVTCWRWLKLHVGEEAAQKGAALYAGFPYVIILVYFTYPIGQLWALAICPLLLEAAHDITLDARRGLLKMSIGYGLLFLTHLPSALAFAPIPIAYAGLMADDRRLLRVLAALGASAWGAAMAALYLLPAAANKIYIHSDEFISGKFAFYYNFYHIQAAFGLLLVLLPLAGLFIELPRPLRKQPFTPLMKFHIFIIVVLTYMMLPISEPLWRLLPPLAYLQFPYRFFNAMLPSVVLIIVIWLPHMKSRGFYFRASLCMLVLAAAMVYDGMFQDNKNTPVYNRETLFARQAITIHDIQASQRIIQPEYQTLWMDEAGVNAMRLGDLISLPQASLVQGKGSVSVSEWSPRRIVLQADVASREAHLVLRRFYFPGWEAGTFVAEPYRALLSARISHGRHDVQFTLPYFDGERLGLRISIAAGILWLLFFALQRRKAV